MPPIPSMLSGGRWEGIEKQQIKQYNSEELEYTDLED